MCGVRIRSKVSSAKKSDELAPRIALSEVRSC